MVVVHRASGGLRGGRRRRFRDGPNRGTITRSGPLVMTLRAACAGPLRAQEVSKLAPSLDGSGGTTTPRGTLACDKESRHCGPVWWPAATRRSRGHRSARLGGGRSTDAARATCSPDVSHQERRNMQMADGGRTPDDVTGDLEGVVHRRRRREAQAAHGRRSPPTISPCGVLQA